MSQVNPIRHRHSCVQQLAPDTLCDSIAQTVQLRAWSFGRSVTGPMIDLTNATYPRMVVIQLMYGAQYGVF